MCCCTVLWVLFRVPTTTNVLLYGVVGTRNNTHNTVQQHISTTLYGVVGVATHNTIQQHILLKCVVVTVVGTPNNTHNTIQHTLLMLLCVTYGPS